jgi:hypothetical protein
LGERGAGSIDLTLIRYSIGREALPELPVRTRSQTYPTSFLESAASMKFSQMKLTDYLAVWGAVVATIVALWNIYKDFLRRDRVKVVAQFMIVMPDTQDIFTFVVTNLTSHKIRVTHCCGYSGRVFHDHWMQRLFLRWRPLPKTGYTFLTQCNLGTSLPAVIEAWDEATFCCKVDNFPQVEELYARTADGREWYCSRADIKRIHEHRLYRAARAGGSSTYA